VNHALAQSAVCLFHLVGVIVLLRATHACYRIILEFFVFCSLPFSLCSSAVQGFRVTEYLGYTTALFPLLVSLVGSQAGETLYHGQAHFDVYYWLAG
jgi:hypothetical protein